MVKEKLKDACIFTTVHNENFFLPIWFDYYSKFFGKDDIYIFNHLGEDESLKNLEGKCVFGNIEGIELLQVDRMTEKIKEIQKTLLTKYKWVLFADADEIVVPNLDKYEDLKDYIMKLKQPMARCCGYEIVQFKEEKEININNKILAQRNFWYRNGSYDTVAITSVPVEWQFGHHEALNQCEPDEDLYLLHLRKVDYKNTYESNLKYCKEKIYKEAIKKTWGYQHFLVDKYEFDAWYYNFVQVTEPIKECIKKSEVI